VRASKDEINRIAATAAHRDISITTAVTDRKKAAVVAFSSHRA
jgi:hypothetical protein